MKCENNFCTSVSFFSSVEKWKYVMIFLLANTLACVTFAVLVNINDKRKVTHKEVISLAQSYQLNRSCKHELVTDA